MGRMREDFDAGVRRAMESRHAQDQMLEEWGRRADENPVEVAATLLRSALYWRRVWRRRYRRLAAKAKRRIVGEDEQARLVAVEAREPLESGELLYALWQHNLWEATVWLMLDLAEVAVAENECPHQAMIGAFMFVQRRSYEALAGSTQPEWLPPRCGRG